MNAPAPTDSALNFASNNHYSYYDSFESQSPRDSVDSPYDSICDKSKKMRKKRNTYMKIEDEARIKLLDAVQQGETLKAAARRYNINYSSAKSILHTFRKEGRILKKSAQERTARKRTKNSSDMEMSPIYLNKQYEDDEDCGIPENSTYQTYHSPESTFKSGQSPPYSDEGPRSGTKTFTFNSFGGFLRLDSQTPQKPDQMNLKNPASTIVLKLDSQKGTSESSISNMQGRNWQLNVNVHNETVKTTPVPQPLRLDAQHENTHDLKISEKLKSFENFYLNYASNSATNQVRRDQSAGDNKLLFKDFDVFTDMLACADETAPTEPHNFDVSCFLSSSPSYHFFKRSSEANPFMGLDHYAAMDAQQHHPFYDAYKKIPYPETGKPTIEQSNTSTIKTAGL